MEPGSLSRLTRLQRWGVAPVGLVLAREATRMVLGLPLRLLALEPGGAPLVARGTGGWATQGGTQEGVAGPWRALQWALEGRWVVPNPLRTILAPCLCLCLCRGQHIKS